MGDLNMPNVDWSNPIAISHQINIIAHTNLSINKSITDDFNPPTSAFEELDFNKADWDNIRMRLHSFSWCAELNNI